MGLGTLNKPPGEAAVLGRGPRRRGQGRAPCRAFGTVSLARTFNKVPLNLLLIVQSGRR